MPRTRRHLVSAVIPMLAQLRPIGNWNFDGRFLRRPAFAVIRSADPADPLRIRPAFA